jgi:hypothetical protein
MGIDNSDSDKFKISNDWDNIGNSTRMTFDSNGNVGIGVTTPSQRLQVQGNAYVTGDLGLGISSPSQKLHVGGNILATGTVTQNSDLRLKKDFAPLKDVLSKIKDISGQYYYWKDAETGTERQIGLIAQELEVYFPELVRTASDEDAYKSVNYSQMTAVLLQAVKEQQVLIESLGSQLEDAHQSKQEILKRLEAVEAKVK